MSVTGRRRDLLPVRAARRWVVTTGAPMGTDAHAAGVTAWMMLSRLF